MTPFPCPDPDLGSQTGEFPSRKGGVASGRLEFPSPGGDVGSIGRDLGSLRPEVALGRGEFL